MNALKKEIQDQDQLMTKVLGLMDALDLINEFDTSQEMAVDSIIKVLNAIDQAVFAFNVIDMDNCDLWTHETCDKIKEFQKTLRNKLEPYINRHWQ